MLPCRPRPAALLLSLALPTGGCFSPTGQTSTATSTGTTGDTTGTATSASTTTGDPTATGDPTTTSAPTTTDPVTSTSGSTTTGSTTTDPGTGTTATTGTSTSTSTSDDSTTSMSSTDGGSCGNNIVETGEECDDGNGSDNDSCTNACTVAFCGDGIIQADVEECDDGNELDTDDCVDECHDAKCGDGHVHQGVQECDGGVGCTISCTTLFRIVFVSHLPYKISALGGIAKADAECNALAADKPALAGRTFAAWLSDDRNLATTRIGVSPVPYRRLDGKDVATNTADLVDGSLLQPINVSQLNMPVGDVYPVWTGTTEFGFPTPDVDCADWIEENPGFKGRVGFKSATNHEWTNVTEQPCDALGHIYCIETAI